MTIEFALRRRAFRSRCVSSLWLLLTVVILIGTYISVPQLVNKSLVVAETYSHVHYGALSPATNRDKTYVVMAMVAFCLVAIGFACFILSRSAFIENELAARYYGLADAICIAGNRFEDFEKAAHLLVPKSKSFAITDVISEKDRTALMSMLKVLRP